MKRLFFLISAIVVSLTIVAQMQVWSNGTIIFSHDQTDVDSILFGSPMQVSTNLDALSSASLAGSVFISSLAGTGSGSSAATNDLHALFFLDGTTGYYGLNYHGSPTNQSNRLKAFTYEINGNDITMSMEGNTINGKIIGRNGLVFTNFSSGFPAVFITLNR